MGYMNHKKRIINSEVKTMDDLPKFGRRLHLKIGLPKGLYYYKLDAFLKNFLDMPGVELVISPDTNKKTLNDGVNSCVDDACLPLKLFHGHVRYLRDKCALIIVPRILEVDKKEFICPKFCGLPEIIQNSIPGLPPITEGPLYLHDVKKILEWCESIGRVADLEKNSIHQSFWAALKKSASSYMGINDCSRTLKVGLLGHAYNIYDKAANMDVIEKLRRLDTGVITEERISDSCKTEVYKNLLINPFWSSIKDTLGAGIYLVSQKLVDGIIYLSSFQCGIDSVVVDLLRDFAGSFPMLVLKLDEHSGEAGMETRLEAFTDMIKRRRQVEDHIPTHGQFIFGS